MSTSRLKVRHLRTSPTARIQALLPEGPVELEAFAQADRIERRARITQRHGRQPLWEGYRGVIGRGRPAWGEGTRSSNQVRTRASTGACYNRLVRALRPEVAVEFGTAFGVSGMFFLSGIETNGRGTLYTFDPNDIWRELALKNLSEIGDRYVSIHGTFEDTFEAVLPKGLGIDLAFVDGIHTADFVYPQVELLKRRMTRGGVLILDDIRFGPDMKACWDDLARRDDVMASLELGRRIGLIELA